MGEEAEEESGRKSKEGEEAERVEQKWLPEFSLELWRARCGLEMEARVQRTKPGEGLLGWGVQ